MKTTKTRWLLFASLLTLAGLTALAPSGPLEPSAPPAPTMKTLDEVEPRIPIPGSPTAIAPFIINVPGSYYLLGDRLCSGTGITVNVDDVTIDLMGYSLIGPGKTPIINRGILITGQKNVEIRNGTIRQFSRYGIWENSAAGAQHRVLAVRLVSNIEYGMWLNGSGHLIKDCTVYKNEWSGIVAGTGCTVTGNTAYNNENTGIITNFDCTVTGNTVYNNELRGISTGSGCTVTGNTAYNNGDFGIFVQTGCTVTGNTAYANNQNNSSVAGGIRVRNGCLVKGNTLRSNKLHNIYVRGNDNAIEENLVTDCVGNGIFFANIGNFYANNRASGNTTNYNNTAGQTDGGGNASF